MLCWNMEKEQQVTRDLFLEEAIARWGLSGNDVRNRLIANGVFELPVGRGKLVDIKSRWVNQTAGG